MSLLSKSLISISLLMSLSVAHAEETAASDKVSVQDVTKHFKDSQELLGAAYKIKSIERALRALNKADSSLKEAKSILSVRKAANDAEVRMKSRLMYRLDQDQKFLNQLKSDLGMAEMDSFESYIDLRRSLLKAPDQRSLVVKMDLQILLTLEARSLDKS